MTEEMEKYAKKNYEEKTDNHHHHKEDDLDDYCKIEKQNF